MYCIYHLKGVGYIHFEQLFFGFQQTRLCDKTSIFNYICHCSSLLFKVSAIGTNALLRPCLHVQNCPPDHRRVNLRHLPGDVGLQLIEGGRARAVDLGFEESPQAEVKGGEVG